ncbi:MAG: tetratricopeptide repeat protein [Isosphaeraceae bacterium]
MEEPRPSPRPTILPTLDDPAIRADCHTARGVAFASQKQFREAIEEFREAHRLLPDSVMTLSNLGMALGQAGALDGDERKLDEAVVRHQAAVRLQPGNVGLRHNVAAVLALAGRVSEALEVLDEALTLDPANARTRAHRSVALLTLGDFENGWIDFELVLADPARRAHELLGVRRWRGETLSGALLINGLIEGQGDCFQGMRFAAEARRHVGSTVLLCPPSMVRLMRRCAGVDRLVTTREALPAVEAQIAPLYLASVFRPTLGNMRADAYLSASPDAVERWRPVIESIPGLKIGVAWQGNPRQSLDARRSFPLAALEPLAQHPGVTLVSLQQGKGTEQLAAAGFRVEDLGPNYQAGDWEETAAILSLLDLVIGCDSAVVHLAGALGRPTWVALSKAADWRWGLKGDTTPWYSTVRLFRQDHPGDWAGVFRRMSTALAELVRPD